MGVECSRATIFGLNSILHLTVYKACSLSSGDVDAFLEDHGLQQWVYIICSKSRGRYISSFSNPSLHE